MIKKIYSALRVVTLVLLILLACLGVGITGHFLPSSREKYQDAEVRSGQVDKKEEEDEGEQSEVG